MTHDPITAVICLDHASLKGGQERVAFDSAIGLKQRGHRPVVFASVGPVAGQLIDAGVETICLDQGDPTMIRGLWNAPAAQALDRLLASLPRGGTIVHVHGWAGALSASIAGPIARSGLPAVFTIHDYSQFCPNGDFYNFRQNEICTLTPLSAACWTRHCGARSYPRKLWRNVRLTAAKHVARLPQVFGDYIAISDLQQAIATPLLPKGRRLHRVANPVSVPDLGRKPDPLAGDIIFVGRLSPEKGVLLFAEAARRAGIAPKFFGAGPMQGELAALYPEAHVPGWRDQTEIRHAMRAARALVFPSVWYEGQPLTVLEAQGLGVPVLVSDACAGRESVENGVTGLWFRSGDVDDLARALVATRDDARIRAMSEAAYDRFWNDPPTLDAHIEDLTHVYRGAIGREAPATRQSRGDAGAPSLAVEDRPGRRGEPAPTGVGTR